MRAGIHVWFLILSGKFSVFHFQYDITCELFVNALYWVEEVPLFLKSVFCFVLFYHEDMLVLVPFCSFSLFIYHLFIGSSLIFFLLAPYGLGTSYATSYT